MEISTEAKEALRKLVDATREYYQHITLGRITLEDSQRLNAEMEKQFELWQKLTRPSTGS